MFLPRTCRIDMVLVGAEGVVENGGVINKLGTYQAAVSAHAHNTPFYVAAESYKVMKCPPLLLRACCFCPTTQPAITSKSRPRTFPGVSRMWHIHQAVSCGV